MLWGFIRKHDLDNLFQTISGKPVLKIYLSKFRPFVCAKLCQVQDLPLNMWKKEKDNSQAFPAIPLYYGLTNAS